MTGEQEIIISAKKELELLYKDFIRCVFCDKKEDKADAQRLASTIDARLNGVIEKLSDYCDDQLEPMKPSFLVAKLKKEAKVPVAFMPLLPEQPFTKRIVQMARPNMQIKGEPSDTAKKQSPVHGIIGNGPVKVLSSSLKVAK